LDRHIIVKFSWREPRNPFTSVEPTRAMMKRRRMGGVDDGRSSSSLATAAASVIGTPLSANAAIKVLRGGNTNNNGGRMIHDDTDDDVHTMTDDNNQDDRFNYALLIALYTLQGIPMGLSASIPFLIQQKVQSLAVTNTATVVTEVGGAIARELLTNGDSSSSSSSSSQLQQQMTAASTAEITKLSYSANAIFALCSWPFSLKLLWAPIVDACFSTTFGRRKSWLVPVQLLAGVLMMCGSEYIERQLGLSSSSSTTTTSGVGSGTTTATATTTTTTMDVRGLTLFFFTLYFLMATQDIAVDGWALTMLSRKNRGKGPVCNSIGQNIGYFLSYVGFLALNDVDSSENIWRPLLRLTSNPGIGLVSLGGFVKCMGDHCSSRNNSHQ
jgi:hypothetical protein